jgi:hypothetical protein
MIDSRYWRYIRTNFWLQKIHNNFKSKHIITGKSSNPHDFYLPTGGKFAPPYTSPNLTQNLSSDWSIISKHAAITYACVWATPLQVKWHTLGGMELTRLPLHFRSLFGLP